MKKTLFTAAAMIAASLLVVGSGQAGEKAETGKGRGHYVPVNGLDMYYEEYGKSTGTPLVLLHGAFSATGTSFGELIPFLSKHRRVISVEQQAHGHTADIDRPLRMSTMAEDTAALLGKIGVTNADFFGYSMGAGIALELGIRHPELTRKLVLASVSAKPEGLHPGVLDGIKDLEPSMLEGSVFHQEYLRIAPRPQDFPKLVERVKEMDGNLPTVPDEAVRGVKAPTQLIIGDSDIVRPEHAVELFRLLGGGVMGDTPEGLPASQLVVLPATSHITLPSRDDLLRPAIPAFLDAPMPK
ncbi:alpha/beta fold hydrolase [Amycolatopsis nigrescens]|uniref:alpha/beta fold hydrolase n=1 Tax=Amycolatopsis nigrescens TaxID=381445 RepID=UPI00037426B9|nr:alpha/beta hydrolase [Amycolatopsis nigrescens]